MNKLFYLLVLPLLIAVTLSIDDSFACEVNCSEEDYMRIMAGYDTYGWWTDHHLTGFFGFSNLFISGSDAQTLDKYERSLKPAFIVKSFVKTAGVTADYKVTYIISNAQGKLIHTDFNEYSNVFFLTNLSGESDTFPAVYNVPKHSTITYTLEVTKMS